MGLNHNSGQKFHDKNVILLIVEKFAYFFKRVTYDSGQKFEISFEPTFPQKDLSFLV